MILVTTGTNGVAFDRLLAGVVAIETDEPLIVQHGPSKLRPARGEFFDYLPFSRLAEYVREARVVITHGGAGSILLAQMNGKRPLVVPRLARFREAVDDHQLDLSRHLDGIGIITLVERPEDLSELAKADPLPLAISREGSGLVQELKDYVEATIATRNGAS